jgi:hypothetical protein
VALRNDPDRYLLIDRMELTPFTINTIINYNSFLALRRPLYLQGNEQFVSERVLKMAEKVLNNLQKSIVDSTMSAITLKEQSLHQALPYYESLSQYQTWKSSNNYRIS